MTHRFQQAPLPSTVGDIGNATTPSSLSQDPGIFLTNSTQTARKNDTDALDASNGFAIYPEFTFSPTLRPLDLPSAFFPVFDSLVQLAAAPYDTPLSKNLCVALPGFNSILYYNIVPRDQPPYLDHRAVIITLYQLPLVMVRNGRFAAVSILTSVGQQGVRVGYGLFEGRRPPPPLGGSSA